MSDSEHGLVVEGWMELTSGVRFQLGNINIETILLGDIAHALSLLCRYGGHVNRFYSVAEHCVHIARYIMRHDAAEELGLTDMSSAERANIAMSGLMHDGGEAYLVDMPRPAKKHLPEYKPLEIKLDKAVAERFELLYPFPDVVKELDNRILVDERQQLFNPSGNRWSIDTETQPLGIRLDCWSPGVAQRYFLETFSELDVARTRIE